MPSASELARRDEEARPLPKAEKFDIKITFGPHSIRLSADAVDMGALNGASGSKIANALGVMLEPHITAMLAAEAGEEPNAKAVEDER